ARRHLIAAATSTLQWGRASMSAEGIAQLALTQKQKQLQWGRASMSAEGCGIYSAGLGRRDASMGPRFDERGRRAGVDRAHGRVLASMGPRFDERGRRRDRGFPQGSSPGFNGAALR